MPETSIVIRTYNEEKHLKNLLEAIRNQAYKDYEIIIVDSGSVDSTLEIARQYPTRVIEIETRDFTFGYSLNKGCEASMGKYLVFVSAHTLPTDKHWLGNLVSSFKNEKVAMVYGRQVGVKQSKFSEKRDFKKFFKNHTLNSHVPLYYANNANAAARKDLWQKRKFDEYLFGLEDIEWAQEMVKNGYLVHYEPKATIHHIHEETWSQVFNRYRREAIAAIRIGLKYPPQVRLGLTTFIFNLITDIVTSFPNWFPKRIEEILRFRYYQWKGSRIGWKQGMDLDFNKNRQDIFQPITNRSVVIKKKGVAEYEEMPLREMLPGDVLIKVEYVGICRTDLEILHGSLGYYRDGLANYPIVPGHEFSGIIVRIGSNNKYQERFKVGQKVVGECILSRRAEDRKEVGVINYNGAYSDYIVMPGDAIHKIPEGLHIKKAALTEPLAVVLRAIRRIKSRLKDGSNIAIAGAGPIGYLAAQVLVLEGYSVSVFDLNKERLDLLSNIVENVSTKLDSLNTFDIIIEATGSKELLERVIKESKLDATIMLLGFPYGNVDYNFEDLVGQEKVIAGSVGGDSQDFIKALEILPQIEIPNIAQNEMSLSDFKAAWELHTTSKYLKIFLKS